MDDLLVEAIRDNIQKYGYSLDPVDLLQNVKAALVAEGWKSPAEVAKARQGWLYEGRMAEREKMKRFIAEARADERKAAIQLVGHYLRQKVQNGETVIAETRIMWLEEAILKGERP
jgi:hypothetical protein